MQRTNSHTIGANPRRLAQRFSGFLNWTPAAYPLQGYLRKRGSSVGGPGTSHRKAARRPHAAGSEPTAAMIRGNIAVDPQTWRSRGRKLKPLRAVRTII